MFDINVVNAQISLFFYAHGLIDATIEQPSLRGVLPIYSLSTKYH